MGESITDVIQNYTSRQTIISESFSRCYEASISSRVTILNKRKNPSYSGH